MSFCQPNWKRWIPVPKLGCFFLFVFFFSLFRFHFKFLNFYLCLLNEPCALCHKNSFDGLKQQQKKKQKKEKKRAIAMVSRVYCCKTSKFQFYDFCHFSKCSMFFSLFDVQCLIESMAKNEDHTLNLFEYVDRWETLSLLHSSTGCQSKPFYRNSTTFIDFCLKMLPSSSKERDRCRCREIEWGVKSE